MYEMQEAGPGTPVAGGTIRKNPSQQKKFILDDGTELTGDAWDSMRKGLADARLQVDMLKLQNEYLMSHLKSVSQSQYVTKDILEQKAENLPEALLSIKAYLDMMVEDLDLRLAKKDGELPDAERIERITHLKRENEILAGALEKETASKTKYKKELRTTKKMAKQALERVAELESELKSESIKSKKESTDLKVEIHTLKNTLNELREKLASADASGGDGAGHKGAGSRIQRGEARARSGSSAAIGSQANNKDALSGISYMEDNEIEGGVGQKVVQLKEKRAAGLNKGDKTGRFETMKNVAGEILKTESGLTVINTSKKVETIVAHEMNLACIQVIEGRNLTPEKKPRHGFEVWFKLEMGSATFQTAPTAVEDPTKPVSWNQEYSYVISTGLQMKPFMPLTVYYRPLGKNGQAGDGEGKELGQIMIPLTTFLPLIGSEDVVSQWMTVTEKESKEVRGIIQLILRVDSNISRSERMLPKEEGFSKSSLKNNIAGTLARSDKIMSESAPLEEIVNLNPLQQVASGANPDLSAICREILSGAQIEPDWRNFRRQSWIHFAAMEGNAQLVRQLTEAVSSDIKIVDATDKAGFSPFMYAVMRGHLDVLKFLRHIKGINMSRVDWNGNTALHLASMMGHAEVVEFLIQECKLSTDAQDENAATPLHHAAFMGHKDCVVALCKGLAMVDAEDRDGNSPLLLALAQSHHAVAEYLKDEKKADISGFNTRGDTCLWATIQTRNTDMMNILLKDSRTDLGRKLGHFDFTLLMRCLLQLDHALCDRIVGVILSQKPDVNQTNKQGKTALYYAVAMDRPNLVTLLIMAGGLVKFKDKSGNTPLHFCNSEAICKTLMAHGAAQQVNMPNVQGNTPLHAAFAFGGPAVADIMLSAGGDMTKKNNDGLTPADCVLVDTKYIALPFYEEDRDYEHSIFIGKQLMKSKKRDIVRTSSVAPQPTAATVASANSAQSKEAVAPAAGQEEELDYL